MRLAAVRYSRWIPLILSLIALLPVKSQDGRDDEEGSGFDSSGDHEKFTRQSSKKVTRPTLPEDTEEGSADFTLPPLSPCQILRSSKGSNEFRPQCNPDGSFKSVQCYRTTGQCWCVDSSGEEIIGTIVASPVRPKCPSESLIFASSRHPPTEKIPIKHTDSDDIIIIESPKVSTREPAVTDGKIPKTLSPFENEEEDEEDEETTEKTEFYFKDTFLSLFKDPLIFAGIIAGAVLALLCIVLLIMFTVYRMRKKDEGSYDLGEQGKSYSFGYTRAKDQEFFA